MARTEIPLIALHPETGEYVEGAEVDIIDRATNSAATVYTTEAGGTVATQPLTTDEQGRITAWANRGRYRIEYTVDALPTTVEYYDSVPGADGGIDSAHIADNAITAAKIATDAVGASEVQADAIDAAAIQSSAVTNAKINDGSVTANKIASGSVDSTKLRSDASTDSNRAVTTNHIRDNSVTTAKVADTAITTDKLATNAANSGQGKVSLQWLNSGTNASMVFIGTTYTTIESISSVAPGLYLALPRYFLNFVTNGGYVESRIAATSGSAAGGEIVWSEWTVDEAGGGTQVSMPRVVWVLTTATIALQARGDSSIAGTVAVGTANIDLVRIG